MQDIGRDIHDNVGQRLTLASIYANQLLAAAPVRDERLASIGGIITESLAELRALSRNLVSTEGDADELRAILLRECERVRALSICAVQCQLTEARFTLGATLKNFLLRIVQEAFQNSLKHAGCSEIGLLLDYSGEGLRLVVRDDGKGFSPGAAAHGIGLQNMSRRAALIGGSYRFETAPGRGVTITLHVPADKLSTA